MYDGRKWEIYINMVSNYDQNTPPPSILGVAAYQASFKYRRFYPSTCSIPTYMASRTTNREAMMQTVLGQFHSLE